MELAGGQAGVKAHPHRLYVGAVGTKGVSVFGYNFWLQDCQPHHLDVEDRVGSEEDPEFFREQPHMSVGG